MCILQYHYKSFTTSLLQLLLLEYIQLPPHRVKVGIKLVLSIPNHLLLSAHGLQVDIRRHRVQEIADWLGMPPPATNFEPRQMPAKRRRAENCVRVHGELLVGNGFLDGNWVIKGGDGQEGDADGEDGVAGGSVTVVGVFGRVTPCDGLDCAVKLVEVGDVLDAVVVDVGVFEDLLLVLFKEFF